MKIGVLSDAHGNRPFYEHCLESLLAHEVDQIYYLGDFVGYYPDGEFIINDLKRLNAHCLMGNHDAMLLGLLPLDEERDRVYQISKSGISKENRIFLSTLLPYKSLMVDETRILFVHGSPWDPINGYTYPDSDLRTFDKLPYDFIMMGHTHYPFVSQRPDSKTVVNVGSCGLPRDVGNSGSFAVLDTITKKVEVKRVTVDTGTVKDRYRNLVHSSVLERLDRRA